MLSPSTMTGSSVRSVVKCRTSCRTRRCESSGSGGPVHRVPGHQVTAAANAPKASTTAARPARMTSRRDNGLGLIWLYFPVPGGTRVYSVTVCTTLPIGRVLETGTFMSLSRASSYSGKVCSGALAFICTTL